MHIIVPKESDPLEKRVAITPDMVAKIKAAGFHVVVEKGAGEGAFFTDEAFTAQGAEVRSSGPSLFTGGQIVVTIGCPARETIKHFPEGASLVGMLGSLEGASKALLEKKKMTAYCLEKLPRISRAQNMDVLSSQNTVAGYAAVLLGMSSLPRLAPLLMTAAGTIKPARVLVLGAGVLGLQAVATAARLGARVWGYDVRPEVREQVESLGGRFLDITLSERAGSSEGGYAQALSEEDQQRQKEAMAEAVGSMDLVITAALTMGKKAPCLMPQSLVDRLAPGSVVVDAAASQGGNCELTKPGEVLVHQGVHIVGPQNLCSMHPVSASFFYARNVFHFLKAVWDGEGRLREDGDQDIIGPVRILSGDSEVPLSQKAQR
ncbi:NAD(P) transhydrogenase subunit alpha [Candidatus Hepatobacter penaei]|uniref:NAD(P) transhydrogenase subunit alpha n=1 Tax=Candidatus Hepatobacter penaei TaxID=1274402 RepID=UPI0004F37CE2|nr:NAD(P) transhydrogenase subunit alpha [Candidatus Hepatobacter penaei]